MKIVSYIQYSRDDNVMVDNCKKVFEYIKKHDAKYTCETCGGSGEYEGEYGPKTCQLCCSRLIAFIDFEGQTQTLDWDDAVFEDEHGKLHKMS